MDCFLMPSLFEGMPYSIIEAQCEGLPCLVSDTLSHEMAITDLLQFLPLDDPQAWIDAIRTATTPDAQRDRTAYPAVIRDAGYSIETSYRVFKESLAPETH